MSEAWRTVRLKDVADVRVSNVDKKSSASEPPVHLCNYMDVYANDYVVAGMPFMAATATQLEITKFGLRRGDVMITKDSETPNDIGIPSVLVEDIDNLVCGYHLALIRPKADEVCSVYLAKQLAAAPAARYFGLNASGSTRFGIPIGAIENFELSLPEFDEQSKIAEVLSTVDRAIAQTEALIAKQQRIKTGLMQDLLTRGIDEHGQLRSEATHAFKDSPLGRIPVEWEVDLLDAIAERGSGHTPNKQHPEYWNGGIKWISLADSSALDHVHINETQFEISALGIKNSSAVIHPPGTVVLSRDAGVGKSAVMQKSMAVSQHFMAWRCGKRLHNYFLYYWLQRDKPRFEGIASGSTIVTIGLQFFKSYQIAYPSDSAEQVRIAKVLLNSEEDVNRSQDTLAKLRHLKTALMQDLLTGKVRVTPLLQPSKEAIA